MTDDDVSARARKELARAKSVVRGRNFGFVGGRKYYSSDPKWVLRREREQRLRALAKADPANEVLPEKPNENSEPAVGDRVGALPYRASDMLPEKPNETNDLSERNQRSRVVPDPVAIVRQFGGAGAVSVRRVAGKLRGGLAPSYVVGLLETLAAEPVEGYRAEQVEGSGNDATWRIVPVE